MNGKKQFIILTVVIVFIIVLISSMVVYSQNQNQEPSLEEKVTTEIDYVSAKLIGMLNQFNGFSFIGYDMQPNKEQTQTSSSKNSEDDSKESKKNESDNQASEEAVNESVNNRSDSNKNQILLLEGNYHANWNAINSEIEELYHTWNSIVVDLHALNVNRDSILKFSNYLNQATIHLKKKNKPEAMEQLTNLYALLPEYSNGYQSDSSWREALQTKANILASYAYVSNNEWEKAEVKMQEVIGELTQSFNSVHQPQNNQNRNKIYILAHELQNAIQQKDKEIFFIQYCSIMEKMETL